LHIIHLQLTVVPLFYTVLILLALEQSYQGKTAFPLIPLVENRSALLAYANTLVWQDSTPRMTLKASSTMLILYVYKRENQQQCSTIDVIVIADACLLILLI